MLSPLINFHPFHGSSTDVGTFGSLLFPRWPNPSLEVFKPIEHDIDLGRCEFLFTRLDHDEALAIGRDVVVSDPERIRRVMSLEEHSWFGRVEIRLHCDVDHHHLAAIAVKKLPRVPSPD